MRIAAGFLCLLLLAACAPGDRVSGGDDFPNSIETLGKGAASESQDSTEWNAYKDAPDSAPGLYDSGHVPDTIPRDDGDGMLKPGLLPDLGLNVEIIPGLDIPGAPRTLDTLIDLVTGVIRTVRTQATGSFQVRDTTWYRRDSLGAILLLRVAGAIERDAGRAERFSFEDGDGDSILSARAGSANIAEIRRSWTAGDSSGESFRRVAAGADLNFNLHADNTLLAYSAFAKAGVDTLLDLLLQDGDGDGFLLNPQRDTNLVDVEHAFRSDGPAEAKVSLYYRLAAFADPARNYPVRYRRVVETEAGVTETVALGRDSMPDFAPGDTGRVRMVFSSYAAADTLEDAASEYRIALSDTAGHFGGNWLLRVDREKSFRFGAAAATRFRLIPGMPVPDGSFARAGAMELRVDLRAGGRIEFTGEAKTGGVSGVYLDSGGQSGPVHFDTRGGLLSQPPP